MTPSSLRFELLLRLITFKLAEFTAISKDSKKPFD